MKATEILEQGYHCNVRVTDFNEKDISIEQELDLILIEKSKLPDLIKILQSFVVMLLLSVSVFGQTEKIKPDSSSARLYSIGDITQWSTVGKWDNSITPIVWSSNQSDTVAVYMLVAKKVPHDYPLELRQIKGYSVTARLFYNSLPFSTYLDSNKKPMPDNYIVWMSIKR